VRVLAASTRGAGHFGPLVPFARACADAGHDVVAAVPRQSLGLVERAGLDPWPLDDPDQDELDRVFGRVPSLPPDEAEVVVLRDVFGRIHASAQLPGLRAAVAEWRPDVVLRELAEYASAVAAEEAGLPHVRVAVALAAAEEASRPLGTSGLDEVGAVEPAIARSPFFTTVPASMEDPDGPGPPGTLRFRAPNGAAAPLPDFWPGDDRPRVYVSFGTVAPTLPFFPPLIAGVLSALGELPVRALLTIGDATDPASLPTPPGNVHVERWVPQADALAQAKAALIHGGFGSALGAMCAGVPAVVIPLFADQPINAARVAALGAGIALEGGPPAAAGRPPAELVAAVRRLLDEPGFGEAARSLAAEAAALPPVEEAVPALEELVRGR
jgi:UDP:flavonoid glycosyltransferase YjiC (YdhE family)